MATQKDIRHKISGVKSTQQITRAMKMMSTAKLRRAMDKLNSMRFYLEKLEQMVGALCGAIERPEQHPVLCPRTIRSSGIILITGDRGLCGSFNHDLLKKTTELITERAGMNLRLFLIGRKGYEFFRKRTIKGLGMDYFSELLAHPDPDPIRLAARNFLSFYRNNAIDELLIVYTGSVSALERRIYVKKMLPFDMRSFQTKGLHHAGHGFEFDPSPEVILNSLIPRYIEGMFLRGILESATAEHGARMIAMGAATDRAEEMISNMTLQYNRIRQAAITTELSEVIGGADAQSD
ncbi:MAG TPA: ATP synthase F1 subunit gamma [Candidatus Ozemobacteraceae bacterium]|nr:ATP synthase F1 subunit gamma [Candidatus Ozemobacteraceae bacterium]